MATPMVGTTRGDGAALRLAPFVTAAAGGDAGAFARLVEETRGVVCAITLAVTRDVAASEDVAQDVYVHAWRGLPRLRNAASFLPWLRELARNRARMAVRGALRRRQREHVPDDDTVLTLATDAAPDALATLLDAEARALLAEALAAVPDGAREVLVLYYREGQSVRQVAELLGLTEAAVKQRLTRARQALRAEYLARAGDALDRTAPGMAFAAAVTGAVLAGATPGVAAAATLGGGALALKSGAVAKLGGKLAAATAASATVAGGVAGLGSGLLGIASGTRRLLAGARTAEARRSIRRAGAAQALGIVALTALLLFTRSLPAQTAAYAALLAGFGWLHFGYLPRVRGRPVQRPAVRAFVAGAVLGALPFLWLWWRVLAR
jgi:RNA polymerase sigma factor (sigma-70 family)